MALSIRDMVVIGPQRDLSFLLGLIQFRIVPKIKYMKTTHMPVSFRNETSDINSPDFDSTLIMKKTMIIA